MEPIAVTSVNFYPQQNSKSNHTELYDLVNVPDIPTPIFRRGCQFFFTIRFDRTYDVENDVIRLMFGFGPKPNVIKGTKAIFVLPRNQNNNKLPKDTGKWAVCLDSHENNDVILQVNIPASVQVGIWHCTVQTQLANDKEHKINYKCPDDIYILFNPWCPDDGVYMENEAERNEYVLNDTGKIWCGTFKKPLGKHWLFGQFIDIVLPAAVFLLDKSSLAPAERGSPVLVARAISAVINSADEDGLLEGRWDGNYSDGTSPHAWTGSATIMDQYLMTGGQPVKYGQCWVFSAAAVTVCRTLGIPCRSTTNYVSAHDTNCSLTVDKYFDVFGNKIENGPEGDCNDSCWNFHVWNDVWMSRPDLPTGFGGWQIIDATPQEKSSNLFQCGPASVVAVRQGQIGYLYDTPFVFSEVNADVVHFKEDAESEWGFSRMSINQYHVGRKILTKKPGKTDDKDDSDMWNVIRQYKNPEGTESERLAVYNAIRGIPKAQKLYEMPSTENADVEFDLVDIDVVPFGDNFNVVVKIVNKSTEERNISAILSASSVYYTGATANDIKKSQGTFKVKPGNNETLTIIVTPEEYMDKLVDHGLIKIYAIANVQETKQTWSEEDDFTLIKPNVTVTVAGVCRVGEMNDVNFSFKNPLKISLTECSYVIEGPGLEKPKSVSFRDVEPEELVNLAEQFEPKKPGARKIVANFTSKEIQGITGNVDVEIS